MSDKIKVKIVKVKVWVIFQEFGYRIVIELYYTPHATTFLVASLLFLRTQARTRFFV